MEQPIPHKGHVHQLSGLDEQERGFSRQIDVRSENGKYRAVLRYERTKIQVAHHATESEALDHLIRQLQTLGYSQLRTRLLFQGETYLGTQESWIEYEDPSPSLFLSPITNLLQLCRRIFKPSREKDPCPR